MKDEVYLKDIVYDDGKSKSHIHTWPMVQCNESIRLYYTPIEGEKNGFYFYAVEWISSESVHFDWDIKTTAVECLFHGVAYWDGIRHLYMGDEATDNYGYHYYPHLKDHLSCLNELLKLEELHCSDE